MKMKTLGDWSVDWVSPQEFIAGWLMEFGMQDTDAGQRGNSSWFMGNSIPHPKAFQQCYPGCFAAGGGTHWRLTEKGLKLLEEK